MTWKLQCNLSKQSKLTPENTRLSLVSRPELVWASVKYTGFYLEEISLIFNTIKCLIFSSVRQICCKQHAFLWSVRRISCTTMHRQALLQQLQARVSAECSYLLKANSKLESQFPGSQSTELHHFSYKNVFKSEGCANSLFFIFSHLIWVFEPQAFEAVGWERTYCLK